MALIRDTRKVRVRLAYSERSTVSASCSAPLPSLHNGRVGRPRRQPAESIEFEPTRTRKPTCPTPNQSRQPPPHPCGRTRSTPSDACAVGHTATDPTPSTPDSDRPAACGEPTTESTSADLRRCRDRRARLPDRRRDHLARLRRPRHRGVGMRSAGEPLQLRRQLGHPRRPQSIDRRLGQRHGPDLSVLP